MRTFFYCRSFLLNSPICLPRSLCRGSPLLASFLILFFFSKNYQIKWKTWQLPTRHGWAALAYPPKSLRRKAGEMWSTKVNYKEKEQSLPGEIQVLPRLARGTSSPKKNMNQTQIGCIWTEITAIRIKSLEIQGQRENGRGRDRTGKERGKEESPGNCIYYWGKVRIIFQFIFFIWLKKILGLKLHFACNTAQLDLLNLYSKNTNPYLYVFE